jgi:hypothetical protein
MQPLLNYIESPTVFAISLVENLHWLFSEEAYLKILYRLKMKRKLNLENPHDYQEKLQWLKLYNHDPRYTQMVDKITAKIYAKEKIGEKYIIPTIGVWEHFDQIDFDKLPNEFVLKTNHSGGNTGVVLCTDKSKLDLKQAREKLEASLKHNVYDRHREWPYKNVKPMIMAESYMSDDSELNKGGLSDYKFTCFNGVADNVMVCTDRASGETKFYFYNRNWNLMPLNVRGKNTDSSFKLPKPICMDEMFEIAGKLSEGIPFLRVDLYCINERPYFGETTFFPASGFDPNILPETEKYFGDKIILPNKNI